MASIKSGLVILSGNDCIEFICICVCVCCVCVYVCIYVCTYIHALWLFLAVSALSMQFSHCCVLMRTCQVCICACVCLPVCGMCACVWYVLVCGMCACVWYVLVCGVCMCVVENVWLIAGQLRINYQVDLVL